jgi:plasmid stabilization system protein ParE
MSLRLIIRPEAEADLEEAKSWYEQRRKGLGDEFLLCVEEALDRIRQFPKLYAIAYKKVRVAVLRRFPYLICYRITRVAIEVLAVPHSNIEQ